MPRSPLIRKAVLANGLTVLTERMPAVRSVALGVWIGVGSRDEEASQAGISHFLEHMLFKGTERRSAEAIAQEIEAVGGKLDAFTSREQTCYYAKVLAEHLPLAVDLLTDLLLRPRLDPEDVEKERGVILQEIRMVEDTPDDEVHDLFTQAIWGDHPLGRPVLGRPETLGGLTRDALRAYLAASYRPSRTILAAAGHLDHDRLVRLLEAHLEGWNGLAPAAASPLTPVARPATLAKEREVSQVHLCLGVEGLPYAHRDRYALSLVNTVLGGGMSSRLFQEVREKRGLVYSIYSYLASFRDAGLLVVYAGCGEEALEEVIGCIREECARLAGQPIGAEEFRRAKEQLKGSLLLGLEGTTSRMTRLAKMQMYFGRTFSVDTIIRGIEEVTPERFQRVAQACFAGERYTLTTIGPLARVQGAPVGAAAAAARARPAGGRGA
ncbi:MAG: insulinase family protein [candidate division NC10 bacterium]|nr:insulinase family protein [candidate division NC10 bacterium]